MAMLFDSRKPRGLGESWTALGNRLLDGPRVSNRTSLAFREKPQCFTSGWNPVSVAHRTKSLPGVFLQWAPIGRTNDRREDYCLPRTYFSRGLRKESSTDAIRGTESSPS
jgi:hypothetical protein